MHEHNTSNTIDVLKRYVSPLFEGLRFLALKAEEFDGRDGEPVAAVDVGGLAVIYPTKVEKASILGSRTIEGWAVDVWQDARAGLFGAEPVAHSDHANVEQAILEVARLVLTERLQARMEADYYADEAEKFAAEERVGQ